MGVCGSICVGRGGRHAVSAAGTQGTPGKPRVVPGMNPFFTTMGCVTVGKSLYLSEPHCPTLENEDKNTTSIMGLVRGCHAMHVKRGGRRTSAQERCWHRPQILGSRLGLGMSQLCIPGQVPSHLWTPVPRSITGDPIYPLPRRGGLGCRCSVVPDRAWLVSRSDCSGGGL